MAYTRYKGDPYWKRANVDGTSADGTPYRRGERVFFYPRSGATYNRITILAITNSDELPSPAEGVNRLVVTQGFEPPLAPVGG